MPVSRPAARPFAGGDCMLGGVRVLLDLTGALVWPERATVVVADLHLEKGSSFARRGQLLPPYDTSATLDRLEAALARHRPRRVISLGDGFHDAEASGRLAAADKARLVAMIEAHEWIWVLGNHDPLPPVGLGGRVEEAVEMERLVFRHLPRSPLCGPVEIAGHLHPSARIRVRGRAVSRSCFVSDGRRMVLPAFGSFTGGLSIAHPAIAGLFTAPPSVHMLGRDRVYLVQGGARHKNEAADWPPRSEETETLRTVDFRTWADGRL